MLLIYIMIIVANICVSKSHDWGYTAENGPSKWPGLCKNGKRQSPINIETDNTLKDDLGSLKFLHYDYAYTGILTNTGHNVQITLSGVPIFLSGGGLMSTYVLEQMHFHWGAEHTIDNTRDALELHLVHRDKQYENVSIASQYDNGVAVVAVLFKLTDDDNDSLYAILKAAESVSQWVGKSSIQIQRKVIPIHLLPNDRTTFYRYTGSLTTPGCQESVTWFVMTEKLTISDSQVKILKNVQTHNGTLNTNYRPTQEIGNRKVYHHLLGYSSSPVITSNLIILFLTIILTKVF
ncbi:putative carbonic anhydrase 3 [Microplitis demolitor]|uniref:putative carbonic anhydrase 3 n=1 Tax=Microplitis demolitor TaxID=69319 RepID=UPI00235B6B0A|nr:putative carbonic anhydrase 3 [Microplitis demolitor]